MRLAEDIPVIKHVVKIFLNIQFPLLDVSKSTISYKSVVTA